jgi:5-methylcytosine-specific restriction endonuclease McrA
MNRWNIPEQLEHDVLARDKTCVYCGIEFAPLTQTRGTKPSWEHIINDAKIITRENIARCCMSCNASKGAKELAVWLQTKYCQRKGINESTVAEVVRNALSRTQI